MALYQSQNKMFGNISVPLTRCVGPMAGYGSNGGTLNLNSSYVSFTPIYTNTPRVITTLQFLIVTAATSTGSPLIQFAIYNCKNDTLAPSTQISGTLTTGIDPTTTGVKTTTFSPTWILPKGLSFVGMNNRATVSNNTCFARGFDGTGREGALLGSLGAGWDGTTPTTNFGNTGMPFFNAGENAALLSDYTSSIMSYTTVGASRIDSSYLGVFLK